MRIAADAILGTHDFSAFCRRPAGADSAGAAAGSPRPLTRRVIEVSLALPIAGPDGSPKSTGLDRPATSGLDALVPAASGLERMFTVDIEANAFCQHMVRSLVGTLVAVGRGRLSPADVVGLLHSGDRSLAARAGKPAPPAGLVLRYVRYPPALVGSPDGIWHAPR